MSSPKDLSFYQTRAGQFLSTIRTHIFLNQDLGARLFLYFYCSAITLAVLGRAILHDIYPARIDEAAFYAYTTSLVNALQGMEAWQTALQTGDKTIVGYLPIAVIAALLDIKHPTFYVSVYWVLYFLPLPFLYIQLCRTFRPSDWFDMAIACALISPVLIIELAGNYFTDIPPLTLALLSLVLIGHGIRRPNSNYLVTLGMFIALMAVAVRPSNALFFAVAGLIWLSMLHQSKPVLIKPILLSAIPAVLAFALVFKPLGIDLAISNLFELRLNIQDTIWKFGNYNVEYGIENTFLFRTGAFASAITFTFFPLLASLAAGIATTEVLKSQAHRILIALCVVAGLTLCIVFMASAFNTNIRYIVPLWLLLALLCAWFPAHKTGRLVSTVFIFLVCLDSIAYHSREDASETVSVIHVAAEQLDIYDLTPGGPRQFEHQFEHSNLAEQLYPVLGWRAGQTGNVTAAVLARNALDFGIHLAQVQAGMFQHSDPVLRDLYSRVKLVGIVPSETRTPEIYGPYVPGQFFELSLADYVVFPRTYAPTLGHSTEFEVEELAHKILTDRLMTAWQQGNLSDYGLQLEFIIPYYNRLAAHQPSRTEFGVFSVTDPTAWSTTVGDVFCNQVYNHSLCGTVAPPDRAPLTALPMSENTFATHGSVEKAEDGTARLWLQMRYPARTGYNYIFVHLIPTNTADQRCLFRVADHPPQYVDALTSVVDLPSEVTALLDTCGYQLSIGVRNSETWEHEFDATSSALRLTDATPSFPVPAPEGVTRNVRVFDVGSNGIVEVTYENPFPSDASRVFVHFIASVEGDACPFFIADHNIQYGAVRTTRGSITVEQVALLQSDCGYTTKVGLGSPTQQYWSEAQ